MGTNRNMQDPDQTSGSFHEQVTGFARLIADQGYSRARATRYRRCAEILCGTMSERGFAFHELDDALAETLISELADPAMGGRKDARFCLERFRDYLIERAGAPARVVVDDLSALGSIRREYRSYLKHQRGLADSTIYHCLNFYDRFLKYRFGDQRPIFESITPDDITSFMVVLRESGVRRNKTVPSHLRNLFAFLFWSGRTTKDLSKAVLSARNDPPRGIPR